jgi:D-alanyl-D-alanine carboxypeptidase
MYKEPPEDDEPREYPEFTYPVRQHRHAATPQRPPMRYRTDEHPGVPQIRRASLYHDQQHTQRPYNPALDDKTEAYKNTRLRRLSHNPAVIIIVVIALITVIIVPTITYFGHNHITITAHWGSTTSNQSQPAIRRAPANQHELIIVPQDTDHPPPPVFATSAYLLDADTGVTLYAHNPFMHLPMLSTTKLMTASLAVEQGNLDQRITITGAIGRDISQLSADSARFGIKPGEIYTLRDLLYGLLFPSGNDAAIAIADTLGGNLQNFVAEMNQKAHQLGLYDTHFMNPHGLLEPGQYSSAHDLALLGRYALSLPVLHKISSEITYHIPQGGKHPERFLTNGNQFLWWYPGVDGGKTGFDGQSDFIQVISCTRNHRHLIGVVMHTKNWWTDMRDLMNWGFDSFTWISPRDVDANQHPIIYDSSWNYFISDRQDTTIPNAGNGRYYIYTGFSISGPIMAYFDKNGGLKKLGYPTKMPAVSSGPVISQQFEHGSIQCNVTADKCQTV